jgi:hypothetical protein
LAFLHAAPRVLWPAHVSQALAALVLLEPIVDSVALAVPDPPWALDSSFAPAGALSSANTCAGVVALRDCCLLLARYPRTSPAAVRAANTIVQLGFLAAPLGASPRDPALSRIASSALSVILQEHPRLAAHLGSSVASLLARVECCYGADPVVLAWTEAEHLRAVLPRAASSASDA